MRRVFAAFIILALAAVPLAAKTDGVCAKMPCCAQKATTALTAPSCCAPDLCAVAPRQDVATVTAINNMFVDRVATITVSWTLFPPASFERVFSSTSGPPPPSDRLALLSVLII